jgi:predicted AAA+ superfamily ATPase
MLPHLAAIALVGAKGVGKTATGKQRAASILDLSVERQRATLVGDIDHIVHLPPPVLIDEWQLLPSVWDRVKNAVDDDRSGGQFLLAGSAGVTPGVRIHSGAGRIVRYTMRPLSLAERGISEPAVSLRELLDGGKPDVFGQTSIRLTNYVDEILASGFPGIREASDRARRSLLNAYISQIVEHDLPENGVDVRRPRALTAWLRAYGAATATDAKYSTILDAATAGEDDKPARATVDSYREHLTRLFVLDPIPAWIPTLNPLKRLTKTPKHHLVDPALSARMAGVGKDGLMMGEGERVGTDTGTWVGALFESLAAQSVRVYADAAEAEVGHLRTQDTTREIDLIVESDDRRIVAIEVKLADTVGDHDVRHLNWLHQQIGDRLADKIIITTGPSAYRRTSDGVAVIPLALLGP